MYQAGLKRALDLALSGLALVVLSPVLAVIAIAIMLDDGKPVLFRQTRVGRSGEKFELLKFRSMPANTSNVPKAAATTLQVTRVGRVIRRLNLDELPQLFNILRGHMSLVGPRPALSTQDVLCGLRRESGAAACLPGLTGLAQVSAYDGMPEDEKARFDAEYANKVSLVNDLRIIVRTVGYLRHRPPVY